MTKFLVETHYTCTFKIVHELNKLNEKSLSNIALGNYKLAFKILAFAFATYPSKTFADYKTYIITALLITGPFARIIASPLRKIYIKIRNRKNE